MDLSIEQMQGLEWLYEMYCRDPMQLSTEWREYFSSGLSSVEPVLPATLPAILPSGKPISWSEKKLLVHFLYRSAVLENFLHTKYVGQKRFSLEGADVVLAMLAQIFEHILGKGGKEVVLGMTHRGRLNVMVNLLQYPLVPLFRELSGKTNGFPHGRAGDVRYHLGWEGIYTSYFKPSESLSVTLLPNPSHLESICPVLQGVVRAKQEQRGKEAIFPVQLHGDAAFAGQGVVYETLQLSRLSHYSTGGTLHLIVDNAIGFTTSPEEGRSTKECSDLAKAFDLPVFHLHVDRPEECIASIQEAMAFRDKMQKDVLLHLHCFRKYGHNEMDEPAYTHPKEYQTIRKQPSAYAHYRKELLQSTPEILGPEEEEFQILLEEAYLQAESASVENATTMEADRELVAFVRTEIAQEPLCSLLESWCAVPAQFSLHPKLAILQRERREMAAGKRGIDWGTAEALAMGVLLSQGTSIRLAGQDTVRGTFSQRHACWADQQTGERYCPFQTMQQAGSSFTVCNTPLSEMAALGFEYGYSLFFPGLVLWEAQFGDFANGAQVLIDQYLSSGEEKWGQQSRLTLLLPHGYEGQGPEHSSARIERFLALSAKHNWCVAQPTMPAQFFHLLVRQGRMSDKKPLVIFTPKALLRHSDCKSNLDDLSTGSFSPILRGEADLKILHVLFCTGKIAFLLESEKFTRNRTDVAIVRLEQLYPFPETDFLEIAERFPSAQEWVWVQEEPANMGAGPFVGLFFERSCQSLRKWRQVMPASSPSPATGSLLRHQQEQKALLHQAFDIVE